MRVLITGFTGFIGSYLFKQFQLKGHDVYGLSRKKSSDPHILSWESEDLKEFENFDLVIHLAGENVAKRYWSKRRKNQIYHSRIDSTQKLVQILLKLKNPPRKVFSASAMGIYGSGNQLTEESPLGNNFLAHVCKDWERALDPLKEANLSIVCMRFGHILHSSGGFLKPLIFMTKACLGNIWGSGEQKISWISLQEIFQVILFCMEKNILGPVNFTTPNPISQKDMMQTLAQFYHRPLWLKLPEKFLHVILGDMAKELFLINLEVFPKKLESEKYKFITRTFLDFLKTLENKR